MAIDSTLWSADIPAGSYALGDTVPLNVIAGPSMVRSGRGTAILKNIVIGCTTAGSPLWRVHVKNSNWIDDVQSFAAELNKPTSLGTESGCVQLGSNDVLLPNSGWDVYAECVGPGTSSSANSVFVLIDLDYPSVSAIADPSSINGIPTSISLDATIPINANGASKSATWTIVSTDYFKAGYKYCLQNVELIGAFDLIFIAFSNAAGMGGLTRIIPVNNSIFGLRHKVAYSSTLVKGPMDIKFMAFAASASSNVSISTIHDYVKARI